MKEERWQDQKSDWRAQWGCLAALFALIGGLVGGLLGLDDSTEQAIVGGLGGIVVGGLIGALIGAVVAGSSHLTARRAHRQPLAPSVALGPHEVYANGEYFRGNGQSRYIQDTHLDVGPPAVLTVNVWSPKTRMGPEEEWEIAVPLHLVDAVDAVPAQTGAPPARYLACGVAYSRPEQCYFRPAWIDKRRPVDYDYREQMCDREQPHHLVDPRPNRRQHTITTNGI